MTLSAARVRGFAVPVKSSTGLWFAHCWTCRDDEHGQWNGKPHTYKGPAAADARTHNKEHHAHQNGRR